MTPVRVEARLPMTADIKAVYDDLRYLARRELRPSGDRAAADRMDAEADALAGIVRK